jgi:formylglycine-generating enzyme required for sulfatase activity
MGDDGSERDNEKPAHEVTLDAFYIGKYPMTNAEYKRYIDDMGRSFDIPSGKEQHPVVNITWSEAHDYAVWAGMRLPTEAEWEKAASWDAGRKRRYPWGDDFDQDKCNTKSSRIGGTTPVGKYSPDADSPYGCADMAGNVWEWTSSLYKAYPYRADDGREDPDADGRRVVRGGSFGNDRVLARCAYRHGHFGNYAYDHYGFRVCVSPSRSAL